MEFDLEALAAWLGSAARVIPRGLLIICLAGGLPEGVVRFGTRVADLQPDDHGVRVRTRGGQEYSGDFVVGADGVHSRVRAAVLAGVVPPRLATWGYGRMLRALSNRI
jgi:FAD-dependent urate hydroxylase